MGYGRAEEWRPVPGYEGRYEVSDQGHVRNLRFRTRWGEHVRRSPRLVMPTDHVGYRRVGLRDGNCLRSFLVHRLVLAAFVSPCPSGHQGSHLNGDAADNRLENLEWERAETNCGRRVDHGTLAVGPRNGKWKGGRAEAVRRYRARIR